MVVTKETPPHKRRLIGGAALYKVYSGFATITAFFLHDYAIPQVKGR
ncbi:hypothetical protein EDC54_11175 [Samsonia erythrinae]|uniref:Uncharacterized protein n=1 Tax=Samsonia erythrinae TaxID=160434 RepID=A0A4R3VM43_9GAMM|nr:hypothetical protein EDC54_11175 [Samsonia erythrinae]